MQIRIDGSDFKDEQGRTLHLRGVNLGGSSKIPVVPDGATHIREGFFEHRAVSFVGRPFPLSEADEHFRRLQSWGLRFIRLLVTWEAVEHAGPGIYDEAYLTYIRAIAEKAGEYGLIVFIDPHQDVWSRFTGGDGAPGWTLEAVGLEMRNFKATAAAIVHQTYGDPFPRMIWPANNSRLAIATMFTLFFGGNDFAPGIEIDGVPVQDYLQSHYINAIQQVAARLADLPHVIGYDTLNEPHHGYIGRRDLNEIQAKLRVAAMPTPFQGMALGGGYEQVVERWQLRFTGPQQVGTIRIVPGGIRAWQDDVMCIWRRMGIWDVDSDGEPHLLRPHYFARRDNRPVSFVQDYLRPFINRYAEAIRAVHPEAIIFVEGESEHMLGTFKWGDDDADRIVYAPHWYDGLTLMLKRFLPHLGFDVHTVRPAVGRRNIRKSFQHQLAVIKQDAQTRMGGVPTVIGEVGIPFDMHNKRAFRTGNYRRQARAMDRSITALEANLLHFTLWNYTADNNHERGDGWNGEDLSIYSPDDRVDPTDINSGGRALEAVVRPYARATAGVPLRSQFDMHSRVFEYVFRHDPNVTAPTEFYVPSIQYPQGYHVAVSDGEVSIDHEQQTLVYYHSDRAIPHRIRITPESAGHERSTFDVFWLPRLSILAGLLLVSLALWRWIRSLFKEDRR